jgi:hypothetical protein
MYLFFAKKLSLNLKFALLLLPVIPCMSLQVAYTTLAAKTDA